MIAGKGGQMLTLAQVKAHDEHECELSAFAELNLGDGAARLAVVASRGAWRAAGGWARYFALPLGRIHGVGVCPRLAGSTAPPAFLWPMSGETPAFVAVHAGVLCRHCFPDEPRPVVVRPAPCAGSGVGAMNRWVGGREPCPVCGKSVAVASGGLIRRHQ